MPILLDDKVVAALRVQPAKGSAITYDQEVKGFGCRVTAAGARSFVLNYRTRAGQERRFTIDAWTERLESPRGPQGSRGH